MAAFSDADLFLQFCLPYWANFYEDALNFKKFVIVYWAKRIYSHKQNDPY